MRFNIKLIFLAVSAVFLLSHFALAQSDQKDFSGLRVLTLGTNDGAKNSYGTIANISTSPLISTRVNMGGMVSGRYAQGANIKIQATPAANYALTGWAVIGGSAGACVGAVNPCDIILDTDKTVKVIFSPVSAGSNTTSPAVVAPINQDNPAGGNTSSNGFAFSWVFVVVGAVIFFAVLFAVLLVWKLKRY